MIKIMKNGSLSILILFLVLPAFTPLLPHGAIHALHNHQAKHHGTENHAHGHEEHNHSNENKQAAHHPIHFDAVTYFTDYLHVDLQSPEEIILKAPSQNSHDLVYTLAEATTPIARYELSSIQSRAPPDIRWLRPDKMPLYLSTLRLRI